MSIGDTLFTIGVLACNPGLSEHVLYARVEQEQWPVLREDFVNTARNTIRAKIYRLSDLPTDIRTTWSQQRIERLGAQLYGLKAKSAECIHRLGGTA